MKAFKKNANNNFSRKNINKQKFLQILQFLDIYPETDYIPLKMFLLLISPSKFHFLFSATLFLNLVVQFYGGHSESIIMPEDGTMVASKSGELRFTWVS